MRHKIPWRARAPGDQDADPSATRTKGVGDSTPSSSPSRTRGAGKEPPSSPSRTRGAGREPPASPSRTRGADGSAPSASRGSAVRFALQCKLKASDRVFVVGSHADLGAWDPERSRVELRTSEESDLARHAEWLIGDEGTVGLAFKFVVRSASGDYCWEDSVQNRTLPVVTPGFDIEVRAIFDAENAEVWLHEAPRQVITTSVPFQAGRRGSNESPPPSPGKRSAAAERLWAMLENAEVHVTGLPPDAGSAEVEAVLRHVIANRKGASWSPGWLACQDSEDDDDDSLADEPQGSADLLPLPSFGDDSVSLTPAPSGSYASDLTSRSASFTSRSTAFTVDEGFERLRQEVESLSKRLREQEAATRTAEAKCEALRLELNRTARTASLSPRRQLRLDDSWVKAARGSPVPALNLGDAKFRADESHCMSQWSQTPRALMRSLSGLSDEENKTLPGWVVDTEDEDSDDDAQKDSPVAQEQHPVGGKTVKFFDLTVHDEGGGMTDRGGPDGEESEDPIETVANQVRELRAAAVRQDAARDSAAVGVLQSQVGPGAPAFVAAAFPGAELTVSLQAGPLDGDSAPCPPEEVRTARSPERTGLCSTPPSVGWL